jgi:hypothetical protein
MSISIEREDPKVAQLSLFVFCFGRSLLTCRQGAKVTKTLANAAAVVPQMTAALEAIAALVAELKKANAVRLLTNRSCPSYELLPVGGGPKVPVEDAQAALCVESETSEQSKPVWSDV